MAFLVPFIPWLIKGAIVLGLMAAVWGLVAAHDSKVRKAEAALWKPKLEAVALEKDTAEKANLALQADVKKIEALYAKQAEAMRHLEEQEKKRKADSNKRLADLIESNRKLAAEADFFIAQMKVPAANQKEACDEATRLLDRIIDDSLRHEAERRR